MKKRKKPKKLKPGIYNAKIADVKVRKNGTIRVDMVLTDKLFCVADAATLH